MIKHDRGGYSDETLVSIAAYGLAGSVTQLPTGPFAGDDWFRLLDVCRAQGLLGMLSAAGRAGDVELSAAQQKDIAVLDQEAADLMSLVEREAVRGSELLAEKQRPHRLLGDVAVRRNYRAPDLRGLTVDTVLLTDAHTARHGATYGACETDRTTSSPSRVPLRATVRVAGHDMGLADLVEPPAVLEMANRTVPTATLEEHLVLACMRFHDQPNLAIQRDIAELALSADGVADRVLAVADGWDVTGVVTEAVVEVWRSFQLADKTRLSVWAARSEARRDQSELARSTRPGRALRRRARGGVGRLIRRGDPTPTTRRSS